MIFLQHVLILIKIASKYFEEHYLTLSLFSILETSYGISYSFLYI